MTQSATLNLKLVGDDNSEVVRRLSAVTAHEPITVTEIPEGNTVDVMLQMGTSHLDVEEAEDALGTLVNVVSAVGVRINHGIGITHDDVTDEVTITVFDETYSSVDRFMATQVAANLGDSLAGI